MSNIEQKLKKLQDDSAKRSLKYYENNKEKIAQRRKEIRDAKKLGLPTPPPKVETVKAVQPVQKVQVVQPVQEVQQVQLIPMKAKKASTAKIIKAGEDVITFEDVEASLKNKTPVTQKAYISNVKNIKNQYFKSPINDYSFIRDYGEKLINLVNESIKYKPATKKSFLISLHSISRGLNAKTEDIFYKEMMRYKKLVEDNTSENTITEKQIENYDTMENLKKILKKMKEETFVEIRDKLLISLYLLKPPLRNDFEGVKILKKETDDKINFIIKQCSVYLFYLNNYKTANTYGEKVILYSKEKDKLIYKLLGKLLKYNYEFLFTNEKGEQMSEKTISARVPLLFEKYLNKHITINTIRHIYESELIQSPEYGKMSFNEKKNKHEELHHDTTTANLFYNKINLPTF